MNHDRKNGTWPELKAKHHDKSDKPKHENQKFEDELLDSSNEVHSRLDGEMHDTQKVKKDRAAKHLSRVQNMLKDMSDYANKNSDSN